MADVTPIPIFPINNVVESLRQLANTIEALGKDSGDVETAIVILKDKDGSVDCRLFGEQVDPLVGIGMCQMASKIISTHVPEEE